MSRFRQLMRMKISPPSGAAVMRAFGWLREGLGVFLPKSLRRSGWRARNRLVYLSPDQNTEQTCLVETSWFGESRLGAGETPTVLPASFVLHPDSYFMTHLSLPAEAASSFAKAVELRLGDVSPIPPEDAAFAVGNVKTDAEGRASAKIAITKKRYLREIDRRYGNDTVGAGPGEDGALAFVFSRTTPAVPVMTGRRFVDAGLLAASLLFLIVAVDVHQQRRLQALSDHETQMLSELRSLRPALSLFGDVDAAALETSAGRSLNNAVATIDQALSALPDGTVVTELRFRAQAVSVSGFTPSGAGEAPDTDASLTTMASDRPGLDRFEMTAPSRRAP